MSDRGTELFQHIFSGIHITIMLTTTVRTYPVPNSKVCATFRPRIGQSAAIRTNLGGNSFAHFFKPGAMLNSLVRQFSSEGRPTRIEYRLGPVGLGPSGDINVAYRTIVKFPNEAIRELVLKIVSTIGRLSLYRFDAPLFVGSLRNGKRLLGSAIDSLHLDLFTGGQRGKILQPKVDTNTTDRLTRIDGSRRNIDHNIQEPVPTGVLGKVRAVLDLAFRQGAAVKYAEGVAGTAKRIALAFQLTPLARNPTQIPLTPATQIGAFLLGSRLGVLFADGIDRAGAKPVRFAAALREPVQIKARMPGHDSITVGFFHSPTLTPRFLGVNLMKNFPNGRSGIYSGTAHSTPYKGRERSIGGQ